jgi:hypothetical protein
VIFIGGSNITLDQLPITNIIDYEIEPNAMVIKVKAKSFEQDIWEKIFLSKEYKGVITINEKASEKTEYFTDDYDLIRLVNNYVGVFGITAEDTPADFENDITFKQEVQNKMTPEQKEFLESTPTVIEDPFGGVQAIDSTDFDEQDRKRREEEAKNKEYQLIMENQQRLLNKKKETVKSPEDLQKLTEKAEKILEAENIEEKEAEEVTPTTAQEEKIEQQPKEETVAPPVEKEVDKTTESVEEEITPEPIEEVKSEVVEDTKPEEQKIETSQNEEIQETPAIEELIEQEVENTNEPEREPKVSTPGLSIEDLVSGVKLENKEVTKLQEQIAQKEEEINNLKTQLQEKSKELEEEKQKAIKEKEIQEDNYKSMLMEKEAQIDRQKNGLNRLQAYAQRVGIVTSERIEISMNSPIKCLVATSLHDYTDMVNSVVGHILKTREETLIVDFSGYSSLASVLRQYGHKISTNYTSDDIESKTIDDITTSISDTFEVITTSNTNQFVLLDYNWETILKKLDEYTNGVKIIFLLGDTHSFEVQYVSNLLSRLAETKIYCNTRPLEIIQVSKDLGYFTPTNVELIFANYTANLKQAIMTIAYKYKTKPYGGEIDWGEIV